MNAEPRRLRSRSRSPKPKDVPAAGSVPLAVPVQVAPAVPAVPAPDSPKAAVATTSSSSSGSAATEYSDLDIVLRRLMNLWKAENYPNTTSWTEAMCNDFVDNLASELREDS